MTDSQIQETDTDEDQEVDLGDLLLEVLPSDGSTMGNNWTKILRRVTMKEYQLILTKMLAKGRFATKLAVAALVCGVKNHAFAQKFNHCKDAVAAVKGDIENRVGGKVESVQQVVASDPESPFRGRSGELNIYLSNAPGTVRGRNPATPKQSAKNRAIASSNSLMFAYADQIIKSCPSVAKVTFTQGFHPEGIYVLSRSGAVVKAACKEPQRGQDNLSGLQWEEHLCM